MLMSTIKVINMFFLLSTVKLSTNLNTCASPKKKTEIAFVFSNLQKDREHNENTY